MEKVKAIGMILLTILSTILGCAIGVRGFSVGVGGASPVEAGGGPVKLKVRTQPYIPGVAAGGQIWVSVDIESPYAWDNTVDGIVGWEFDVHVDPDVLEPMGAYSADFGYFLYDFIDWNMYVGHYPTILVGTINKASGDMIDIAEFIMGYGLKPGQLDVGAGGNSTDPWWYGGEGMGGYGLCRLRFKSKSQTTATVINITDAAYWTMDPGTGEGVRHAIPKEDITNGYYSSAPTADFTYSPEEPLVNQEVTFNASTSYDPDGPIVSYEWNFSDGTPPVTKTNPIITHNYTTPGPKVVTLNVTDNEGLWDTESKTIMVYAPPIASFTYSPSEPGVGQTVTFNGSTSYDPDGETIVSYDWDFGDETTGTGNITTHRYTTGGTYTVTLNVTDDEGSSATTTDSVTVSAAAPAAQLDVKVDVGSIHFRGEIAEFYVATSFVGESVDAEINATIYYNGALHEDLSASLERIAKGFYRVLYTIPSDAPVGTYVLFVNASFFAWKGISLKAFLVSPTLTAQNAMITDIQGDVATILTDTDAIRASLDAIDARLIGIEGTVAKIYSTLGELETSVVTINATLIEIDENVVTIESILNTIEADIGDINAEIAEINGNMVTIKTDIGTIKGTIISIQGDTAAIKTDIGIIKAILEKRQRLTIQLSGEHDYLHEESVRIRLVALVRDPITMEPVSHADVTVDIYDPDGNLWMSAEIRESGVGTGIYEWHSSKTIRELMQGRNGADKLEKGVYLVHARASFQGGPAASDVLTFHIDPPTEDVSNAPLHYYAVAIIMLAGVASFGLLRRAQVDVDSWRNKKGRNGK